MAKKVIEKTQIGAKTTAQKLAEKFGREMTTIPEPVSEWYSTGSVNLDSIVNKGAMGGIPCGRVIEVYGPESSGKTFLALIVAANAQKMGAKIVVIDAEHSIDTKFLTDLGIDISEDKFTYIEPDNAEEVLETIEFFVKMAIETGDRYFILWDSLANTVAKGEQTVEFGKMVVGGEKAKLMAQGFRRLSTQLGKAKCTLVVLNQVKANLAAIGNMFATADEKETTPGGAALRFAASLRIKLSPRKGKSAYARVDDAEDGFIIGSEVKVTLVKSKFGTQYRTCSFKIISGGQGKPHIADEESWFDAIEDSEFLKQAGAWYTLIMSDGSEEKFTRKNWMEKIQDPAFKKRVLELLFIEQVEKFARQEGNAAKYYKLVEERVHGEQLDYKVPEESEE